MKIERWYNGDSIRLAFPPLYADNPPLKSTGRNLSEVTIFDANKSKIAFKTDSLQIALYRSLAIRFIQPTMPCSLSYWVTFSYDTTASSRYMPLPGVGQETGFLEGNYLFAIPFRNTDIAHLWRDPADLSVSYETGASVLLFGDPQPVVQFSNPYELLFSMNIIMDRSAQQKQQCFTGSLMGQDYRFVNLNPTLQFSPTAIQTTETIWKNLLTDITSSFGVLEKNFPITIITGINDRIGFEGYNAFCVFNLLETDPLGGMAMTLAHEFFHSWIGVRVGEYDAPWWKEATAFYLGHLIAKRDNLSTQEFFKRELVTVDLTGCDIYALADPEIRSQIFVSKAGPLVYRMGGQVCMLMDRRIREQTGNKMNLVDILAAFVKEYNGSAFMMQEYTEFIRQRSGASVDDIVLAYVNTKGLIPGSILLENYRALGAMGALGTFVPETSAVKDNNFYPAQLYPYKTF